MKIGEIVYVCKICTKCIRQNLFFFYICFNFCCFGPGVFFNIQTWERASTSGRGCFRLLTCAHSLDLLLAVSALQAICKHLSNKFNLDLEEGTLLPRVQRSLRQGQEAFVKVIIISNHACRNVYNLIALNRKFCRDISA